MNVAKVLKSQFKSLDDISTQIVINATSDGIIYTSFITLSLPVVHAFNLYM